MEAWWDQCWLNETMEGNKASSSWTATHVSAGFSLESEIRCSTCSSQLSNSVVRLQRDRTRNYLRLLFALICSPKSGNDPVRTRHLRRCRTDRPRSPRTSSGSMTRRVRMVLGIRMPHHARSGCTCLVLWVSSMPPPSRSTIWTAESYKLCNGNTPPL